MINYQSTPDFYNDYISHHGILGMHWGTRNGPPYPLGSDVSTGKRLKYEKKTINSSVKRNITDDFPGLNDKDTIYNNYAYSNSWSDLFNKVLEKSGDWYNRKGKSKGFKEYVKKMDKLDEKYKNDKNKYTLNSDYRKEREKLYNELFNTVLDDLGYEHNKRNKELIRDVVIWD